MAKQSFIDKLTGNKAPKTVVSTNDNADAESLDLAGEVDHLWMKEDIDAKKPKSVRNPKIDTGILKNRIADKIAKLNNN